MNNWPSEPIASHLDCSFRALQFDSALIRDTTKTHPTPAFQCKHKPASFFLIHSFTHPYLIHWQAPSRHQLRVPGPFCFLILQVWRELGKVKSLSLLFIWVSLSLLSLEATLKVLSNSLGLGSSASTSLPSYQISRFPVPFFFCLLVCLSYDFYEVHFFKTLLNNVSYSQTT